MSGDSTLDLLRRNPLFAGLDGRSLARLLAGSLTHQLPRGAVLFEEGGRAEAVHVLLSGRVGLIATGGTDQLTVIESFGAGEVVVAPAAILGLPYLVGGQVTQDARIVFLPTELFRRELDQQPQLARAMVDALARHWRVLVELMKDLKLCDGRARLAHWLARNAVGEEEATVQLVETKAVLARRLGMAPESLSRVLSGLETEGLIAMSGQTIKVLDSARLVQAIGTRHEPRHER